MHLEQRDGTKQSFNTAKENFEFYRIIYYPAWLSAHHP
jgi:hypothetical protein